MLFATAALIIGCGGGGTAADTSAQSGSETTNADATTSSGPLTKAEFVKQADQICQDALKKKDENVQAALKDLPSGSSAKVTKEAAGKLITLAVLPVYNEIIEGLEGLSAPKGDEATTELIVQKYEAAMQAAEADPAEATASNPFQAGDRAAEAYGIKACIL